MSKISCRSFWNRFERVGLRLLPCFTHDMDIKLLVIPLLHLIEYLFLSYTDLMTLYKLPVIPAFSIF